jgi:hypothetical protein
MRLTIIREDGVVGIDGKFRKVDMSSLPPNIRAVQWNGGTGHVEYDDMSNAEISSITSFQIFIDFWNAAANQPMEASSAELKAAALSRIDNAYRAAVQGITGVYPREEIESWPRQETEAREWLKDASAETPWLDRAAAERGISKADLAERIMDKAGRFALLHGALTGKRQRLRDQIAGLDDTATPAQLDVIQW